MPTYQKPVDEISAQTGTTFRRASKRGLAALGALRLPKPVVDFFASHEPSECAEGQVRLWPIAAILQENRDLVPGVYVTPLGYIVFATTFCGDTYCFDLNKVDKEGEPRIVLISHEGVGGDISAQEAFRLAKPIAKNLYEFLEKFAGDELDERLHLLN
jgi:hypothetical protein